MTKPAVARVGDARILPEARNLALTVMRLRRGLKQGDLAALLGYTRTAISYLESGHRKVKPRMLLKVAGLLGFGEDELEALVFGLSAGLGSPDALTKDSGLAPAELEALARQALRHGSHEARDSLQRLIAEAHAQRRIGEREEAARLYREISGFQILHQEVLIETRPELQTWAMVERICEESAKAATDDPKRALALGNLALRCTHTPGIPPAFRWRLEGYAWAFIANARRVGSDLPAAQEAFRLAWESWRKVRRGASDLPLGAWRIQDLEASLKRAQGRGRGALALLARALRAAPTSERGRLLVIKATTYEMMGQSERAVSVLYQAQEWIKPESNPRLYFALKFNLAVNLEFVGNTDESRQLISELRNLATEQRSEVSLARVLWLEARTNSSVGLVEEAISGFEQVRRDFLQRKNSVEVGLVSIELAMALLHFSQWDRVKQLAKEALTVFSSQRIDYAALAALKVFCESAEQETATVELAKETLKKLRGSQLLNV